MRDIQRKELERAVRFIEALGCKFKVITAEGEEFGTLEVKPEVDPKHRKASEYPYGELTKWYRPFIDFDAAVGTVQLIPVGKYPHHTIRSGVCATLTKAWGKDNYTTAVTGDMVEVLRIA